MEQQCVSNVSRDVDVITADTIDCLPPPYSLSERMPDQRVLRRSHRSQSTEFIISELDAEPPGKKCCDPRACRTCVTGCLKLKVVLLMLSVSVLFCVATSVVLGIIRTSENRFLTLSLMFAGLGLLLVTVVLICWRCTPQDHEPCHLLFGLGGYSLTRNNGNYTRRSRARFPWIGGRLFPEFQYRRPPPSYSVSMQECHATEEELGNRGLIPQTPPPQYKAQLTQAMPRPAIHVIHSREFEHSNSSPPSYYTATSETQNSCSTSNIEGIVNPTFQSEQCDIIDSREDRSMSTDNLDQMVVENLSVCEFNDITVTLSDFRTSLGEITHL